MVTNLPMMKPLLGAAVGLQSLVLVGVAAQPILKGGMFDVPKKGKKMKPINHKMMTGNMIKSGVGLMIGIPLVSATAGMVNNL